MIKKFSHYILESKDNSIIDAKLDELSDLLKNSSNKTDLMYQWEDEEESELIINFMIDNKSYRYEFELDDLFLIKIIENKIDYTKKVSSIDEGMDMIEKETQDIINVNEDILNEDLDKSDVEVIAELILSVDEKSIDRNDSSVPLIEILETELNNIDEKLRSEIIDLALFNMFDKNELIEKIGYTLSSYDIDDKKIVEYFKKAVKKIKSYE